jgi:S-adenosylmethionine synthetase
MARNIVVRAASRPTPAECDVEICEQKGLGHPDTITDAVCEAASRELSLAYREAYGAILHHNLDKGLLVGGRSAPRFGGGAILRPARIVVAGRASRVDSRVDPAGVAVEAAQRTLREDLGFPTDLFEVTTAIGEGAANLRDVFARAGAMPLANDTSFGVGFAPYSPLEALVLHCAGGLASESFRTAFPFAGLDYKIMGHRVGTATTLTVALAFVDRHLRGVASYFEAKEAVLAHFRNELPADVTVYVNTLDDPSATDESGVYVTVSGTSAEMGDDGQVGRGNRASRLITPARPMSLEACAGKNPVAHVGKIYNVVAMRIARDVHETLPGSPAVDVIVLSEIGAPIDEPQVASIEVGPPHGLTQGVERRVREIADDHLSRIRETTDLVLQRAVSLF